MPQHKQVSCSGEIDFLTGTAGDHLCGSVSVAENGIRLCGSAERALYRIYHCREIGRCNGIVGEIRRQNLRNKRIFDPVSAIVSAQE